MVKGRGDKRLFDRHTDTDTRTHAPERLSEGQEGVGGGGEAELSVGIQALSVCMDGWMD